MLVIGLGSTVCEALESQLDIRQQDYQLVGVDGLQNIFVAGVAALPLDLAGEIGVVVNTSTIESLQVRADSQQSFEFLERLVSVCNLLDIPLIQLSSSEVFDGTDCDRHREEDDVSPAGDLGSLLVKAEQLVKAECKQHIILRTGPLFDSKGDNLLTRLLGRFDQSEPLSLSAQGKACPLHVRDLARVISAVVDQLSCGGDGWGIYHYCSTEPVSHYQFAEAVLAVASQFIEATDRSLLLDPVAEVDADWQSSMLNCEKILFTFGIKQLPWRAFIAPTIKAVYEKQSQEVGNE